MKYIIASVQLESPKLSFIAVFLNKEKEDFFDKVFQWFLKFTLNLLRYQSTTQKKMA